MFEPISVWVSRPPGRGKREAAAASGAAENTLEVSAEVLFDGTLSRDGVVVEDAAVPADIEGELTVTLGKQDRRLVKGMRVPQGSTSSCRSTACRSSRPTSHFPFPVRR